MTLPLSDLHYLDTNREDERYFDNEGGIRGKYGCRVGPK
jgi:hypothetical protein